VKRGAFHALAAYAGRRRRVRRRAEKEMREMWKLMRRIVARWRGHTALMLGTARMMEARFVPLKRTVFEAWRDYCFKRHSRTRKLKKPSQLHMLVVRPGTGIDKIYDMLSRPGRMPAYVSFGEALSGKAVEGARAGGTRDEQPMELKLSPRVQKRDAHLMQASQVFCFGHVQIYTEPRRLGLLEQEDAEIAKDIMRTALLREGRISSMVAGTRQPTMLGWEQSVEHGHQRSRASTAEKAHGIKSVADLVNEALDRKLRTSLSSPDGLRLSAADSEEDLMLNAHEDGASDTNRDTNSRQGMSVHFQPNRGE
jgi:hypothetical protein